MIKGYKFKTIVMELMQSNLTNQIIKSFYKVYNTLGYGFLEKVYEKALYIELSSNGLSCSRQYPIKVFYSNHNVGDYYADMIVENKVILELKAAFKRKVFMNQNK